MSVLSILDTRPIAPSETSPSPQRGRMVSGLLLILLLWAASAGLLALGVHAAALITY